VDRLESAWQVRSTGVDRLESAWQVRSTGVDRLESAWQLVRVLFGTKGGDRLESA
jgi:hypothetical protein